MRKREIVSHQKEKSLYGREVAWCIGKVELEKIRPVDISEILRDAANGYDNKKPRPAISNDLMRLLRNLFDHGIKLESLGLIPRLHFASEMLAERRHRLTTQ